MAVVEDALVATVNCYCKPGGLVLVASREGRISLSEFREKLSASGFTMDADLPSGIILHQDEDGDDRVHSLYFYRKPLPTGAAN